MRRDQFVVRNSCDFIGCLYKIVEDNTDNLEKLGRRCPFCISDFHALIRFLQKIKRNGINLRGDVFHDCPVVFFV